MTRHLIKIMRLKPGAFLRDTSERRSSHVAVATALQTRVRRCGRQKAGGAGATDGLSARLQPEVIYILNSASDESTSS